MTCGVPGMCCVANVQRQIDATDRQIDMLVYALYGLTEEEVAVVQGKPRLIDE